MVSRNDTNEFIRGFAWSNGNSVECVEHSGRFGRLARGQKALSRAFHGN